MIDKLYRSIFFGAGVTVIPKGICFTIFLMNMFESMVVTSAFPYLPNLVKKFGVSEVNAAKEAAIIALSMYISRIFSSLVWGYVCDIYGDKFSILLSGASLTLSTFSFGFSNSMTWCFISRLFQGFCLGLGVTTKALISCVADNTNQAAGLLFIFSGRSIGFVAGSSMAGFLAFPVENYPHIFHKGSFFDSFKIFLPNILIAAGLFSSLLCAIYFLPNNQRSTLLSPDNNHSKFRFYFKITTVMKMMRRNFTQSDNERKPFADSVSSQKKSYKHLVEVGVAKFKQSNFIKLLRNRNYLLSNFISTFQAMFTVGYEDLFPVFVATSTEYHGIGMLPSDIGLLYFIIAASVILPQSLALNKLVYRFGAKKVFVGSTLLFSLLAPCLPAFAKIKKRLILWIGLWISQSFLRLAMTAGFLSVNLFINNSVEPEIVGFANGVGLSTASIGRVVGTATFGNIYTWSMKAGAGFPFNQYCAFLAIAIMGAMGAIFNIWIPKSLDQKKNSER